MPTIPTVFRSIRPNDVQFRPFKAYKNYSLKNTTAAEASQSGYFAYTGIYQNTPPLLGDINNSYASNSIDNRNQQVVWKQIDHKYYRYPYDPARSFELTNRTKTQKRLFRSASILTVPYFESGERIKPGSVEVTASGITLRDDGYGNLRDINIPTASLMNDDDLKLYLSFNDAYRLTQTGTGLVSGRLKYELRKQDQLSTLDTITITGGVTLSTVNSGLCAQFDHPGTSSIRIPHDDIFDRMNACDDWTLSFWLYVPDLGSGTSSIISKYAVTSEQRLDRRNSKVIIADKIIPSPNYATDDLTKYRRPIDFSVEHKGGAVGDFNFRISDGTFETVLYDTDVGIGLNAWKHIAIVNNGSTQTVQLFVNDSLESTATMPPGPTGNKADIVFGTIDLTDTHAADGHQLAEFRFYDASGSRAQLATLNNRVAGERLLYQTNIVGNVFYRNGQIVISSPINKYNVSNGAFFDQPFNVSYKGQHTIYENEVMVRVPADTMNVSMNPSATYRPPAGETELCAEGQSNRPPGELRKTMFTNGTAFPYISTIGLYNDVGQLLAVGKLAQPIQKRDDVDMNFIIRWDY